MSSKDTNEELVTEVYQILNDGENNIISKGVIKDVIYNGQNKFVSETIKRGMFEDIMLKYFGKFKARHNVIQKRYSKKTIKTK